MNLMCNISINTFSAIVLSVIWAYSRKFSETESKQNKIFSLIIKTTIVLLIFDTLGRMDGYPDTMMPVLNKIGNFFLFLFNPLVSSFWVLYVNYIINPQKKHNIPLIITIIITNVINCVLTMLSLKYNWYYYIDAANVYHRGPLNNVSTIFSFFLMFIATMQLFFNRKKMDKKQYYALHLFIVPPIFCIVLQMAIYGVSFIYNGVAISLLILFLYVQIQDIFTDYLTGVANRKKLEMHLKKKILNSTPDSTFSAIMLDLDNFKKINDTIGHKAGDKILQNAAIMLRKCIDNKGLIARYGGDEFCIVLDTSDLTQLSKIVKRIKECVKNYNATNDLPFKLGLSMGYAIYQYGMNIDDYQNMIDKLMYEHKHSDL